MALECPPIALHPLQGRAITDRVPFKMSALMVSRWQVNRWQVAAGDLLGNSGTGVQVTQEGYLFMPRNRPLALTEWGDRRPRVERSRVTQRLPSDPSREENPPDLGSKMKYFHGSAQLYPRDLGTKMYYFSRGQPRKSPSFGHKNPVFFSHILGFCGFSLGVAASTCSPLPGRSLFFRPLDPQQILLWRGRLDHFTT